MLKLRNKNSPLYFISDPMYYPFLGDEFLRLMVLRYIFCESVLRMHRSFRARTNLPRAYPPLPDDLFEHRDLVAIVLQMADYIGVRCSTCFPICLIFIMFR